MSGKGIQRELIHDLLAHNDMRVEQLPIMHQDHPMNVTISMQLNAIVDVVSKHTINTLINAKLLPE